MPCKHLASKIFTSMYMMPFIISKILRIKLRHGLLSLRSHVEGENIDGYSAIALKMILRSGQFFFYHQCFSMEKLQL